MARGTSRDRRDRVPALSWHLFRLGKSSRVGKGSQVGKIPCEVGLHPAGGMVSSGKVIAAPSPCEHQGLSRGKGESHALPRMPGYSHQPKSTVIFHPLLLCLVQTILLKHGHVRGANAESECRNAMDGEKVGVHADNMGFTGAWDRMWRQNKRAICLHGRNMSVRCPLSTSDHPQRRGPRQGCQQQAQGSSRWSQAARQP